MSETAKVRLWRIGGTAKAYLFSTVDKERSERKEGTSNWVPRSQIEHVSMLTPPAVGKWPECEVTMPLWLAEAKGFA